MHNAKKSAIEKLAKMGLTEEEVLSLFVEDKEETIVVEDKTNPEKFVTKTFQTREIFAYSDYLVDKMTSHIDRERQKKAS